MACFDSYRYKSGVTGVNLSLIEAPFFLAMNLFFVVKASRGSEYDSLASLSLFLLLERPPKSNV